MPTYLSYEPIEIKLQKKTAEDFLELRSSNDKLSYRIPVFKKNDQAYIRFWPEDKSEYYYFLSGKKYFLKTRAYYGNNDLIKNGPLIAQKNYLAFSNQKPFFPLIDTMWYGLSVRTSWEDFVKLVKARKKQGFNTVMMVVGIPPEVDIYSSYAANSYGQFLKQDHINEGYFLEVDKKVKYLIDQGVVPVLLGGWGWQINVLGLKRIKKIWKEIIARYHAWPVIYCLCGEVDLIKNSAEINLTQKKIYISFKKLLFKTPLTFKILRYLRNSSHYKTDIKKQTKLWNKVGYYVRDLFPHHRLLTVHVHQPKTASEIMGNPGWLDIDTIQSGHSWKNAGFMIETILKYSSGKKVFINLEPWYEQILGRFGANYQRYAFWLSVLSGAKGFAYGANGIWQMSNEGENFLAHWGKADWHGALSYPGARQIGLAKKYLSQFSWWKIKPLKEAIFPHWSKKDLQSPFAAQAGSNLFLVYFPLIKIKNYRLNFLKKGWYLFEWINPVTFKCIQIDKVSGKIEDINVPKLSFEKDLLLVIKRIK